MAGKGGYRANAGRKKGVAAQKSVEVANKMAAIGISPLEVMFAKMRAEQVELPNGTKTHVTDDMFQAAVAAAPYSHAKLAAVQHSGDQDNPVGFIFKWQS